MENPPAELKKLAAQLRGRKSWLTQSIRSCNNLISIPQSAANRSFILNQMQAAANLLNERKEKVETCLLEMEDHELSLELDDARRKREDYYDKTRDEITTKYEVCYNKLLDTMSNFDTVAEAEQNATIHPSPIETSTAIFKIQESLKPFILQKDHTPQDLYLWQKQYKAFHLASNLDRLNIFGQQSFFAKFIERSLMSVLDSRITATTPIFDDANLPAQDSCFSLLQREFQQTYPLVSRRMQFFCLSQERGMNFTEFLAKIKSFGSLAELESLSIEDLYIYKAITGLGQEYFDLREKLLELPELTLSEIERVSRGFESAQSTIKSINSTTADLEKISMHHSAAQVRSQDRKIKDRVAHLKDLGVCIRCGEHLFNSKDPPCWAIEARCKICSRLGHVAKVCSQGQITTKSSDSESENESDSQSESATVKSVYTD